MNGISYIRTVWLNPTADINGAVEMDVETKAVEDPISWNLEELKEEALGNGIVSFGGDPWLGKVGKHMRGWVFVGNLGEPFEH